MEALHNELRITGKAGLIAKHGAKFVKFFGKYLQEELGGDRGIRKESQGD